MNLREGTVCILIEVIQKLDPKCGVQKLYFLLLCCVIMWDLIKYWCTLRWTYLWNCQLGYLFKRWASHKYIQVFDISIPIHQMRIDYKTQSCWGAREQRSLHFYFWIKSITKWSHKSLSLLNLWNMFLTKISSSKSIMQVLPIVLFYS